MINKGANVITAGTNMVMAINEVAQMGIFEQIAEWLNSLRQQIAEVMAQWTGIRIFPITCPEGYTYNPETGECEPLVYPPPPEYTGLEHPPKVYYLGYDYPNLRIAMRYWFSPTPKTALIGTIRYADMATDNKYEEKTIPMPRPITPPPGGLDIGEVWIPVYGVVDKGVIEITHIKNLQTGELTPVKWRYHFDMQELLKVPYRPYPLQPEVWEVG